MKYHDELKKITKTVPKYGNDNDYVDQITLEISNYIPTGSIMTVGDVIKSIEKDLIFFLNSNGEIIFSDGEPT